MPINEKIQVKAPQFSAEPVSFSNRVTTSLGALTPLNWMEITPGNRVSYDVNHLIRTTPMLAPIMDQLNVRVDTVYVPARILSENNAYGINFEKFHNPATPDANRPAYPKEDLIKMYCSACAVSQNGDALGTLYDYFGFPTFEAFNENFHDFIVSIWGIDHDSHDPSLLGIRNVLSTDLFYVEAEQRFDPALFYRIKTSGTQAGHMIMFNQYVKPYLDSIDGVTIPTLRGYTIGRYGGYWSGSYVNWDSLWTDYEVYSESSTDVLTQKLEISWDDIVKMSGRTSTQLVGEYISWLKARYFDGLNRLPASQRPTIMVNVAHMLGYWKAVYDWYINTNIDGDPDELYFDVDFGRADGKYLKPFNCRYGNDAFTTAFTSPQAGSAIPIPVNGTIADLRSANRLQEFKEIVMYSGKRYIDNILSLYGQKSSNVRLDRTEVLSRNKSNISIEAITQTNQSAVNEFLDSPIGSLSGQGVNYRHFNRPFDYTAEEHGFLYTFISVVPKAAYFQGIPRYALKSSFYDFLVPHFDEIGEQDVRSAEIYLDPTQGSVSLDSNGVPNEIFGYQRRYYEYRGKDMDEIHGNFRSNLDYWNLARKFSSKPTLGSDFIEVNPDNGDLNRIFAVSDSMEQTILVYANFSGTLVAPLNKYLEYGL